MVKSIILLPAYIQEFYFQIDNIYIISIHWINVEIKNRGLLIVISVLIVLVFLVISKPLFSPSDNSDNKLIGCGIGQGPGGQGQGPPIPPPPGLPIEPPPHYGNCVADGLAMIDADKFGVDEGQLRYDITMCLQKKGYQVPVGQNPGAPINLKDALECKKKAMEQFEITESFGTGSGDGMSPPISSGDSVFENNCPKIGSSIIFTFMGTTSTGSRVGHLTICKVKKCNPGFGAATLACSESSFSPASGTTYDLSVANDGTITSTPPIGLSNMVNIGYTQIRWLKLRVNLDPNNYDNFIIIKLIRQWFFFQLNL